MTIWHALLIASVVLIAAQFIGAAIRRANDRHSEQLAETDRDWRWEVHPAFQTPATRHLGKTAVGLDDREAA